MSNEILVNEQIDARFVRLIDGENSDVLSINQALSVAQKADLDLVKVAEGDPPVCRLLNADRYRYERKKTERNHAKRQRELTVDLKEIQLRPVTDDNDLNVKARRARSFLDDGDKVKVVLRFRGREKSHKDQGREIIHNFLSIIGDYKIDKPLTDGEGDLTLVLSPVVTKAEVIKKREKSG